MGYGSWSDDADKALRNSYSTKSNSAIFSNSLKADMSPADATIRESRDSEEHPNTLGVVIGMDETGSMHEIPVQLTRNHLPALQTTMIKHGLPDVQTLFIAVGDHRSDASPLQVGQFESGTDELNKWLTSCHLESNGGGNGGESYLLVHYFVARHTSTDAYEKRGIKNALFTIGDEPPHMSLHINEINYRAKELLQMFKNDAVEEIKMEDVLREAQRTYDVFHIHLGDDDDLKKWQKLLPERVIHLDRVTGPSTIAEVIASTVASLHGADLATVVQDFDPAKALTITTALAHININSGIKKSDTESGIIAL